MGECFGMSLSDASAASPALDLPELVHAVISGRRAFHVATVLDATAAIRKGIP